MATHPQPPGIYGRVAGRREPMACFDVVGARGRLCGSRCVPIAFDGVREQDWSIDPWAAAAEAVRAALELARDVQFACWLNPAIPTERERRPRR